MLLQEILNRNKFYLAGGLIVGLVVVGAIAGADYYSRQAEEINAKLNVLSSKLAETDSQRLRALNLLNEAHAWSEASKDRIIELEKELSKRPYPPKPKPAPATIQELAQVIIKFGAADGLTVLEDAHASTLGRSDALLVYSWASEAARVAPLEDRLSGTEAVVGGLKTQVAAQENELNLSKVALTKTTEQLVLTQGQAKLIGEEAVAAAKKAKIQRWLYAGGALVTGYLIRQK